MPIGIFQYIEGYTPPIQVKQTSIGRSYFDSQVMNNDL